VPKWFVADRNDAYAVRARGGPRQADGPRSDDLADAVVAVEDGDRPEGADGFGRGHRFHHAGADTGDVPGRRSMLCARDPTRRR
jgi:hypothetical protein